MEHCDLETRYKRHLMLPQVGKEGQLRLLGSRAVIIGAGGLGSPVAMYLAAAGVGHIDLIDNDTVDTSNLQRQIIHFTGDVGHNKVTSAKEKLQQLNPGIEVTAHSCHFNPDNARQLIAGCNVVVDCTDNQASKFLINDVCVGAGIPLVHGAINMFQGNVMTILPGCATLRDLFPGPSQNPDPSDRYGVLGAIAGIIGTIQAAEAIKVILGIGEPLTNQVLTLDALTMTFTKFKINPRH